MDYLMIVRIGLYGFIAFSFFKIVVLIILIVDGFIKLNKNEIRYKKPIAEKVGQFLGTLVCTLFYIGIVVAILNYGFY